MKRFLDSFIRRLAQFWSNWAPRKRIRTVSVAEMPDRLKPRRLYLFGGISPWSAALLCPCGCREVIHVSLLPTDSPTWTLVVDRRQSPTLSPSVWRTAGCRSHFLLRSGRVVWC